jgi:hypothetical protein
MTRDEWVAAQVAAAPPLTPAQTAVLRGCLHAAGHMKAAPARQQKPQSPAPHTQTERQSA